MINKISISASVILIVVILLEFVFYKNISKLSYSANKLIPSPTQSLMTEEMKQNIQKRYTTYTDWLTKRNAILDSSYTSDSATGTILAVEDITNDNVIVKRLTLKNNKGSYTYNFSTNELSSAVIAKLEVATEKEISFNDLKKGDTVTVTETFDQMSTAITRTGIKIIKK